MIVVAIAVTAMLTLVPFGFNQLQTNSVDVQAVEVGQQYLDQERTALLENTAMPTATTAPIDQGTSYVNNGGQVSGYGTFTVTPDGCPSANNVFTGTGGVASVSSCSVTISWTEDGASKSVQVQGYVTH